MKIFPLGAFTTRFLFIPCYLATMMSLSYAKPSNNFALSEQWTIGQQVTLRFTPDHPAEEATPLRLKNGLALTFADIMSIGDLYGIAGAPISHGLTKQQKAARFKDVFHSFAKHFTAVNEVKELNAVIQTELKEIKSGIEQGETVDSIYQRIGNEIGRQLNCITGGACTRIGWWLYPGRYLSLARENYDHFSPNSLIVYKTGHHAALQQAIKARKTGNRIDLEKAYAMEALAAHYLADHFTAGYLRTPRQALKEQVTPEILGALIATYMQYEENKYGVHVHNTLNEHWVAYGDYSYSNPMNEINQYWLLHAVQRSVDEVFEAYDSGVLPDKNNIMALIPHSESFNAESTTDIAPMFYWDEQNKQLYRRTDLSNPYDHHWTTDWWGWSTLITLKNHYGISSTLQYSLNQYLSSLHLKKPA